MGGEHREPVRKSGTVNIDATLDDFEQAWHSASPPEIDRFLADRGVFNWDKATRCEVIAELVMTDLEYRWKRSATDLATLRATSLPPLPKVEDYISLFGEWKGDESWLLRMIGEEYRVRQRWGDRPGHAEFFERFSPLAHVLGSILRDVDREIAEEAGSRTILGEVASRLPAATVAGSACVPGCGDIIAHLLEIGLITQAKLADLTEDLGRPLVTLSPEDLVSRMVEAGVLTSHQASWILTGQTRKLLIDDYIILDRLGAGGMGVVFKARHRTMERLVALKIMSSAVAHNAEAVRRFKREIRTAAQLHHPNIVAAYDARTVGGELIFVMEYVDGDTLRHLVERDGPLPVGLSLGYIIQAAEGLAYAHDNGIIHRDIKPDNLLIERSTSVLKILDLGLARIVPGSEPYRGHLARSNDVSLTEHETIMGTVDYMAPEQAVDAKAVDQRSDVYSLGCTLYFLLTANIMYEEDTIMKRVLAHRTKPIPSLRDARIDVPATLDTVFRRMVAKRPEGRYNSMRALIADLQAVAQPSMVLDESSALTSERWFNPPQMPSNSGLIAAHTKKHTKKLHKQIAIATVVVCASVALMRLLFLLGQF